MGFMKWYFIAVIGKFSAILVLRAPDADMTATGAAYFAGLGIGFWDSIEELQAIKINYIIFDPKMEESLRKTKLKSWDRAIKGVLSIDK